MRIPAFHIFAKVLKGWIVALAFIMSSSLIAGILPEHSVVYLRLQDTTARDYRRFSVKLHDAYRYSETYCVKIELQSSEDRIWKFTVPSGLWLDEFDVHIDDGFHQDCLVGKYKTVKGGFNPIHNLFISDPSLGVYWTNYVAEPEGSPQSGYFTNVEEEGIDYCSASKSGFVYKPTLPQSITSNSIYDYAWFRYSGRKWIRLDSTWLHHQGYDTSISTYLNQNLKDTTFFACSGSHYPIDYTNYYNMLFPNFSSQYLYDPKNIDEEGKYSLVASTGNIYKGINEDVFDHSRGDGGGAMLVAHRSDRDSFAIWQQQIAYDAYTDYMFSFWVMRWDESTNDSVEIGIRIDSVLQQRFFIPNTHRQWQEIRIGWRSGMMNSNAEFAILTFTQNSTGKEIAIDDIMLRKKSIFNILHPVFYDERTANIHNDTLYYCDTLMPYSWHGKTIHHRGIYYDTLRNELDCDTARFVLNFFVSRCCPTPIRSNTYESICDTLFPYPWHNTFIDTAGTYTFYAQDYKECDSIFDTINIKMLKCQACLYDLMYRKWETFIFVDNASKKFNSFQWYHNDEPIEGETKQYLFSLDTLSGYYNVQLTDLQGNSFFTCPTYYSNIPYTVKERNLSTNTTTIFNHLGQIVHQSSSTSAPFEHLTPGLYVVIENVDGNTYVNKIIINPQ